MGSKSAPAPFMPYAPPPPEAIDRDELDKETLAEARRNTGTVSTVDGEEDPQASLLSERKYWSDKEKKDQKKGTLLTS